MSNSALNLLVLSFSVLARHVQISGFLSTPTLVSCFNKVWISPAYLRPTRLTNNAWCEQTVYTVTSGSGCGTAATMNSKWSLKWASRYGLVQQQHNIYMWLYVWVGICHTRWLHSDTGQQNRGKCCETLGLLTLRTWSEIGHIGTSSSLKVEAGEEKIYVSCIHGVCTQCIIELQRKIWIKTKDRDSTYCYTCYRSVVCPSVCIIIIIIITERFNVV